ncbi:MAG: FAD-binding oxidoreductase [Marinilabiliales bacterium]|nr:MAG: FAD-binding oxidoreductase [Marinilabiliales bacterium]
MTLNNNEIQELKKEFSGEILTDDSIKIIYATDASAYRELPLFVCYPKNIEDIKLLISFAGKNNTTIIPRTAGTSLAGQVVGNGIIADVSRHMTSILELNREEKWVRVQPGVVLDELNKYLAEFGLFFGPETSTSNRCMIGGMLGNNACGARSLVYGSTRDHTLEVDAILSDGSQVNFKELTKDEYNSKLKLKSLEGDIFRKINSILSLQENIDEINKEFPPSVLKRRNTGYAIDLLANTEVFSETKEKINISKLLAGSEGTLAFTTAIKLNLVDVPPKFKALLCVHFETVAESLRANNKILEHSPRAIELMDKPIMDLSKKNIEQAKNRFFISGDPGAVLIIELAKNTENELDKTSENLISDLKANAFGYHYPIIKGNDISRVWDVRKAGLGILNNMVGDAKPVAVVEDTAILPKYLPDYITDFEEMLKKYDRSCVYYAHAATGELHLRPVLNLKKKEDVELFHTIALETAHLVKKYKGSLSGEHGDGRLRGAFIPFMIGDKNYAHLKEIKAVWDPNNIFNKGKITDSPDMNSGLRYENVPEKPQIKTIFDFSNDLGILRAVEKCNGTAVCRKTEIIGGTMCPSYMASRNENQTTRARANILREFLTRSDKTNPFNHKEIYDVMDLCLSCKACKSECPSSVDIAKLKAEFLQHYYDDNGISLRTRLIANITKVNMLGSYMPSVFNFFLKNSVSSYLMAKVFGFSTERKFPQLSKKPLDKIIAKRGKLDSDFPNGKVYLFNDEFTRFNDTAIGIKAIMLLNNLGYEVIIPKHIESGRTYLSKGLIRKAKKIANINVSLLKDKIANESPLIGIEPSAILSFRDEYPELVDKHMREDANTLKSHCFMIDEFLANEMKAGKIKVTDFTHHKMKVKLHGHCHQKSLASTLPTKYILSFPENYQVEEIPSGCCGMAGSFGYEKEHYELSMQVGELVLFPNIRNTDESTIISAPGTSCRHQIKDGTKRTALHPIEVLWDALIK